MRSAEAPPRAAPDHLAEHAAGHRDAPRHDVALVAVRRAVRVVGHAYVWPRAVESCRGALLYFISDFHTNYNKAPLNDSITHG